MPKQKGSYEMEDIGWFKVSRRITDSSRWFTSSAAAIKLLIYMLNKASNPLNPTPGDVMQSGHALAAMCGLSYDETMMALEELMGPDPDSHSTKDNGAVIGKIEDNGKVIGYRLVNFLDYNPNAIQQSAVYKAKKRRERASKAANAMWDKARGAIDDAHEAEVMAEDLFDEEGE